MKDLTDFIQPGVPAVPVKRSLKSILDQPIVVTDWKILKSKFSDDDSQSNSKYICLYYELERAPYYSYTSSAVILTQIQEIEKAQGDTREPFSCKVCKYGTSVRLETAK